MESSPLLLCEAIPKYSSVSADYRLGSSGGEVDWWLVRCHGESGEVVDVSIFFHSTAWLPQSVTHPVGPKR